MAELQSRTQGETEEPAATVARSIEKALHQYRKHLILASERGVKDAQETVKTLKQRDIKQIFDKHEVLREAVGNVAKAAAEREKESERLHAFATKELEVAQKILPN